MNEWCSSMSSIKYSFLFSLQFIYIHSISTQWNGKLRHETTCDVCKYIIFYDFSLDFSLYGFFVVCGKGFDLKSKLEWSYNLSFDSLVSMSFSTSMELRLTFECFGWLIGSVEGTSPWVQSRLNRPVERGVEGAEKFRARDKFRSPDILFSL